MKKILFVTNVNPFSLSFGAEQRSYLLLQSFLQNGCMVDVAYMGHSKENSEGCPENVNIVYWNNDGGWNFSLLARISRALTFHIFPVCKEQEKIIDKIVRSVKYDYIVCRYLPTASYAGLFKYADKLILDIDDMPDQAISAAPIPNKWYKILYRKMMAVSARRDTRKWIKQCKACFLPNRTQADINGCTFLPNIPLNSVERTSIDPENKNILFVGYLGFAPNWMGVDYFLKNCWNQIVESVPDARFLIAGKGLCELARAEWELYHNVEICGFVKDITEFYARGNIVVVPVFSGSGTNIKVIEAFAQGKAAVLSKFSIKGFEDIVINNKNAFVAESNTEFIRYIVNLLNNPELIDEVSNNALSQVVRYYSLESITKIIREVID